MAWAKVQGLAGTAQTGSSTTVQLTFPSSPGSNNLLLVAIQWGTNATAPSGVADARNGAWSALSAVVQDTTNGDYLQLWGVVNGAAAPAAVTVTATWAAAKTNRVLNIMEASGQAAGAIATLIDVTAVGQKVTAAGTTTDSLSSGNMTTVTNGDLIFSAVAVATGSGVSAGTGYTLNALDAGLWLGTEFRTQATAGSVAGLWTPASAGDYSVVAVALKGAATGVSTTATLTATATVTATGVLGKATGASLTAAATITASSPVPAQPAALTATATVSAAGVVARSTTATRSITATITATGSVGRSQGAALTATATVTAAQVFHRFITGVTADNRHLTDQNGLPIFGFHDVMWTLTAQSITDQELYFADRAARGFTVVETTCTPFYYTSDGSSTYLWETRDGLEPFVGGDPTVRNSTYWARFDQTVALAEQYGITLIVGAITDDITSSAGPWGPWSTGDCTSFGTFLGNRYKTAPNIVWLIGVDYNPSEWSSQNANFSACVTAMRAAGDAHLYTLQNYSVSISDTNTGLASLNWEIQGGYSYPWNGPLLRLGWNTNNGPMWDLEGDYEGENNQGGPTTVAYTLRALFGWALTHGGAGMGYGRRSVWRGDSTWKTDLNSSWILPLRRMVEKIQSISSWHKWVPDQTGVFVTAGAGTYAITGGTQTPSGESPLPTLNVDAQESDYATSAYALDGSGGAVYVPSNRTLTIDKTKVNGTTYYWLDASNASLTPTTATFTGNNVTSPGTNAAGDQDWILVMEGTPFNLNGTGTRSATATITGAGSVTGRWNAENGTDGTTLTTGNVPADGVGIGGTSTATFSNLRANTGTLSYKFTTSASTDTSFVRLTCPNATKDAAADLYLNITVVPTTNALRLFTLRNSAGNILYVRLLVTGKLEVQDAAGTTVGTTTANWPTNQWTRLSVRAHVGTTTSNGTADVSLYDGSGALVQTISIAGGNLGTTDIGFLTVGKSNPDATGNSCTVYADDIRFASNLTAALAPMQLDYSGTSALAATAAVTATGSVVKATGAAVATTAAITPLGYSINYDSVVVRTQFELKTFVDWLVANSASGYIGEFGTMNELSGAELPLWNNLGYAYYDLLRRAGLIGTQWAGGRIYSASDPQAVLTSNPGAYGVAADVEMGNSPPLKMAARGFPTLRGINMAGGEFSGPNGTATPATLPASGGLYSSVNPGTHNSDYGYPVPADWVKLAGMGVKLVRMPFAWERVQRTLNGSLDSGEVALITAALASAAANGINVILDCHNYASYSLGVNSTTTTVHFMGAGTLTAAHLTDLWTKVNASFGAASNVVGFDLMNEPAVQDNAGTYVNNAQAVSNWKTISAAVVSALRTAGVTKTLVVSGWWGAPPTEWVSKHGGSGWITDSLSNFYYTAHQYFDEASTFPGSGTYARAGGYTYAIERAQADLLYQANVSATATITATGTVGGIQSNAAVSAAATITPAGAVGKAATSTTGIIAVITAAGVLGLATGAPVSATATVTATGNTNSGQPATLTSTATITTAGTVTSGLSGGASLTVTATIGVAHTATMGAGVSLPTTATIIALGSVATSTGATRPVTATITAAGVSGFGGPAALTVAAGITAAGVVAGAGGSVSVAAAADISATGTVGVSAAATLTANALVFASAGAAVIGAAAVITAATITATGVVDRSTGAAVGANATITAAGLVAGGVSSAAVTAVATIIATTFMAAERGAARTVLATITATGHLGNYEAFTGPIISVGPPHPATGITVSGPHGVSKG